MSICVEERGLCVTACPHVSSRFLHQNEVNLRDRETKWPPTSISACICTGGPKLDLRSPIVDHDDLVNSHTHKKNLSAFSSQSIYLLRSNERFE